MPKTKKPEIVTFYTHLGDVVVWKSEGGSGPLWVRRSGTLVNYQDSGEKGLSGEARPKWFTERQAMNIAVELKLPFSVL